MRNDGRPQTDLYPIMDFDTFRVFVLKVYIFSNEDFSVNLDPSETVEERAERGRAG